jgi:hypothetical protein
MAGLRLSSPFPIDVSPASWGGLAASYDVNGDHAGDLLYVDGSASPPRFRLALSGPPPDIFDFWDSDCEALRELPTGRLFLRDLDGDAVPTSWSAPRWAWKHS